MGFEKFLRKIGWPWVNGHVADPLPAAPEGEVEPEELQIAKRRSRAIEKKTQRCETEIASRQTEGAQE